MAGTVELNINNYGIPGEGSTIKELRFLCAADSSDASFPATSTGTIAGAPGNSTSFTKLIQGWFLLKVNVNPGAVAPTVNSNVFFKDGDAIDLLGGAGENLIHDTGSKAARPLLNGKELSQPIIGDMIFTITGNAVNSALVVVKFIFTIVPV